MRLSIRRALLTLAVGCVAAVAAAQPTEREGTVTTDDGVKLFYRQVGSGSEVIVVPVAVWVSPHLDRLATGNRRVIYYDPRGRGRSGVGDLSRVSLDRATRDLEAMRAALQLDRMTLIGWSGYGMEMAVYALAHPDRVARLVQLNPVPPRQEPFMSTRATGIRARVDAAQWARYQSLVKDGRDQTEVCRAYNRAMAGAFSARPSASIAISDRFCTLSNEWPDEQGKFFAAFMPSIAALDLRPRIAELTMPRLVLHGDRDLIPLEGVREWLDGAGGRTRLVVIQGADHTSFIDRPDDVLRAIEEFLKAG